jgi:hypothetical protein
VEAVEADQRDGFGANDVEELTGAGLELAGRDTTRRPGKSRPEFRAADAGVVLKDTEPTPSFPAVAASHSFGPGDMSKRSRVICQTLSASASRPVCILSPHGRPKAAPLLEAGRVTCSVAHDLGFIV